MLSYDLPDNIKYKLSILFMFELPIDTGNLRYNATCMQLLKPGARYYINTAEADYTEIVFEHYLYNKGINFMYDGAFSMYSFLNSYFNGGRPEFDKNYLMAKRNVTASAESNEGREIRNILHGSGDYASDTLKAQILGGK